VTVEEIEKQAASELAAEDRRIAVEAAKVRIRERRARSLWRRLFPYRIIVERV
jgi:hypothetical protein